MKFTFKTVTNDNGTRTVHAKGLSSSGNKFEGKATCSPNDTFDFGWGANLAETRARTKQVKKILTNELKRNEKLIIMQRKSDRELGKLADQLEALQDYEAVYSE